MDVVGLVAADTEDWNKTFFQGSKGRLLWESEWTGISLYNKAQGKEWFANASNFYIRLSF